ncbi:hypothetical protein [Spartinivicinus poritis]|uniref:Uncharacterized protein n=1 Tax=Spartinivicinus poritis TaxID=2994640 RepID=A0ABT5UBY5_9GAMM|nr:hypothetical protein [Spartinivicinus sp. A2-2]MDE1463894.1 hypothetical protein [Spartinivicinus sp. A2-2]
MPCRIFIKGFIKHLLERITRCFFERLIKQGRGEDWEKIDKFMIVLWQVS